MGALAALRLAYRLAYDANLLTDVLQVFARAVFGFLRRQARDCGIGQTQCGAVTFIQRYGGHLNLNPHFHLLAIDGVYAPSRAGGPEFFPLRGPEDEEVAELVQILARRIPALLQRRGLAPEHADAEDPDPLDRDQPGLAALYASSVRGRTATGPDAGRRTVVSGDAVDPEALPAESTRRCASASGFSLHANVAIAAHHRLRLEQLFRYAGRPPVAAERLELLPDGRLRYRFKTPWRNGATHAVFTPLELLAKLAALVPTPRAHLVRYSGVLAPAAKWRSQIVPATATAAPSTTSAPESALAEADNGDPDRQSAPPRNYTWSQLMKRIFLVDVLKCAHCGGPLRMLSAIHPPEVSRKILDHLGIPSRPPPIAPALLDRDLFADPA